MRWRPVTPAAASESNRQLSRQLAAAWITVFDWLQKVAEIDDRRLSVLRTGFAHEVFAGRWLPLPYIYNALKTLPFQHAGHGMTMR